ncbi:hypothetical protein BKA82DRAFT_994818 [Pisolithus tinctorius]|uniref:Uncharacterized protein n=1 Tax=Pisolithus tinctorius Marx 270 TaxID=870435 RepID=A0A0C3PRB9_PISTI|nr:hypothetical protein BKA82DRAFT_994818 [Pisolithus tinctorius]KIO11139.1 hypothetical protein M404DRAFT_994818 [Pisolithus tinctorius Marx 270]
MDSSAATADGGICASCCLICVSALQTWCNLHAFGADCCGGQRGCCGNLCASCFDHDDFDERLKRDQERRQGDQPVSAQPSPAQEMSVPTKSEATGKPS